MTPVFNYLKNWFAEDQQSRNCPEDWTRKSSFKLQGNRFQWHIKKKKILTVIASGGAAFSFTGGA